MKFVMLVYESPAALDAREEEEKSPYIAAWRAYHKALLASGVYDSGAPLKDVATATTVRMKDGKRCVQDGPFAEAKEQLGGFMILDLPSLDAALDWAARCPAAAHGALEVRPMDEHMHAVVCGDASA